MCAICRKKNLLTNRFVTVRIKKKVSSGVPALHCECEKRPRCLFFKEISIYTFNVDVRVDFNLTPDAAFALLPADISWHIVFACAS